MTAAIWASDTASRKLSSVTATLPDDKWMMNVNVRAHVTFLIETDADRYEGTFVSGSIAHSKRAVASWAK